MSLKSNLTQLQTRRVEGIEPGINRAPVGNIAHPCQGVLGRGPKWSQGAPRKGIRGMWKDRRNQIIGAPMKAPGCLGRGPTRAWEQT
jgi:hypothetical protein